MSARAARGAEQREVAVVERAHRRDDGDPPAVAAQILGARAHRGGVAKDLEREGHARQLSSATASAQSRELS